MEKTLKFNSQIATSREQSERLLVLGIKKETADMWHYKDADGERLSPVEEIYGEEAYFEYGTPAWSLHRLIEMMPMTLIEDKVYHERWELNTTPLWVTYRNQDQPGEWIGECLGQGMYNNIIDCIEWLIKEGYFNKEYLV